MKIMIKNIATLLMLESIITRYINKKDCIIRIKWNSKEVDCVDRVKVDFARNLLKIEQKIGERNENFKKIIIYGNCIFSKQGCAMVKQN